MNRPASRSVVVPLAATIVVYLVIGTLYAAFTPTWQVPDEPAHYNYVRSLADGRGFPVLTTGDYTQEYLRRLTSEGFPPELSIEPLEYEDHQPPLYYLLATPIYLLFRGAVLPLRLFSVALGAALLAVSYGAVMAVFPEQSSLPLMSVALIAFIPQHVAMTAGVNNDTLAELAVASTLWALMVYVRGRSTSPSDRGEQTLAGAAEARPWGLGVLLACALLTKTTAYVVLGVALGAVAIRWRRERRTWRWAARQTAWMFIPALLFSGPWFVRNIGVYGWSDPLGLARHNAVVEGQPRSSEWLGLYGWTGLLGRMALTTFHSFWGQLGWMAVPLPQRVYQILLLFSALIVAGFVIWLVRASRSHSIGVQACPRGTLLVVSAGLTLFAFIWYNITFVQHQGRYLFPALVPLATAAALGLETLVSVLPRPLRPVAVAIVFGGMVALDVYGLFKSLPYLRG